MSVFYTKRIPFFRMEGWNRKAVPWENCGTCPYCGMEQSFQVNDDDSLKIRGERMTAMVSCWNPGCGKQLRIKVSNGAVRVYRVEG